MALHASEWLRHARVEGGLLVPGRPSRRGVDLLLSTENVELRADGARCVLGWESLSSDHRKGPADAERWSVRTWANGWFGPRGIGIEVTGRADEATSAVRQARTSWLNRLGAVEAGIAVPLTPLLVRFATIDRDRQLLDVLCSVLAERPDARSRLADSQRVGRLIETLVARMPNPVPRPTGLSPSAARVVAAMRELGHEHQFGGRPLPGDRPPSASVMTEQVLNHLATSADAATRPVEPAQARGIVEHHLGVEPWPFEALTVD